MNDLSALKQIPIIDVAKRLGISVRGTKAMCFMGHDKASPSLSFLKSRNTWRCFGACGKHGDAIALVMEKENMDFKSALAWFATNYGADVHLHGENRRLTFKPQTKITTVAAQNENEFAADAELHDWLINHCPAVSSPQGINYLTDHGITLEFANRVKIRELKDPKSIIDQAVEKWGGRRLYRSGLAWGKNEKPERLIWDSPALIFPFYQNGSAIYLQARMFAGDRKYLNPRGIAKPLFNADRLADLPTGNLIHICEGVPDALAMEAHGLMAVGVLGATSFRPEWVDQFIKLKVAVVGQGDEAERGDGQREVSRQSTAQAAAPALPARHGRGRRTGWTDFHADRRAGVEVQNLWSAGFRTLADTAGFTDAVFLPAHARLLAGVHFGNDHRAIA